LAEILHSPSVEEWLDSYKYYVRVCPGQNEEMVPIGALCYGSIFIFRDNLKQAIVNHPLWTPNDNAPPPIFDTYVSEFIAAGKKTKRLFVSSECSRQEEVTYLLKLIYDGTKKRYPNGSMMLFIPHSTISNAPMDFKTKILFNHTKFFGDKTLFCIGGLQDLHSIIKLKMANRQHCTCSSRIYWPARA